MRTFLEAEPGTLSSPYETDRGIYVFALADKRTAGPRPLDEVRNRIAGLVRRQKKVVLAARRLEEVRQAVRTGASLEGAAREHDVRYAEPDPFARVDFVPVVGTRNAFVGEAFRLEEGSLSDVVRTQNGAYVLRLLEKVPPDPAAFEEEKQSLANQIVSRKRNDLLAAWFSDLRERAEIEDYRHRFYTEF